MKRISIIGLLIVGLIFQGCKNEKSDQEDIISEETENLMQEEVDTSAFSNDLEIEEDSSFVTEEPEPITKSESKPVETTKPKEATKPVVKSTTTEKVVVKTTTETTKPAVKEEPAKKEVVVEEVIKTETETKVEPVAEKPAVVVQSTSDWKVPAKYQTMKNPIPAKTDAAIGKSLYSKHCKSCHGSEGYGDGTKAADMKGDLGDFSSANFQKQSDGALFYKTTTGRDDMPEFSKKLTDEDRWLVVNYMRTLAE
jgi:mono/diheme cytochrome c family protein